MTTRSEPAARSVPQLLVPQSHFVVGPSLDLMVFPNGHRRTLFKDTPDALFEFRLPPEFFSAAPSRRQPPGRLLDSSLELCFPSAHTRPGDLPFPRAYHSRVGSALRVWLPSRRFSPPKPAPALFHADSTLGIQPFGVFPSRKVSRAFPPVMNPLAVSPTAVPSDESSGRNDRSRLPGFDPFGNPSSSPGRLTLPITGYSLGLWSFPGHSGVRLADAPTSAPLTRFQLLR